VARLLQRPLLAQVGSYRFIRDKKTGGVWGAALIPRRLRPVQFLNLIILHVTPVRWSEAEAN